MIRIRKEMMSMKRKSLKYGLVASMIMMLVGCSHNSNKETTKSAKQDLEEKQVVVKKYRD